MYEFWKFKKIFKFDMNWNIFPEPGLLIFNNLFMIYVTRSRSYLVIIFILWIPKTDIQKSFFYQKTFETFRKLRSFFIKITFQHDNFKFLRNSKRVFSFLLKFKIWHDYSWKSWNSFIFINKFAPFSFVILSCLIECDISLLFLFNLSAITTFSFHIFPFIQLLANRRNYFILRLNVKIQVI